MAIVGEFEGSTKCTKGAVSIEHFYMYQRNPISTRGSERQERHLIRTAGIHVNFAEGILPLLVPSTMCLNYLSGTSTNLLGGYMAKGFRGFYGLTLGP